MSDFIFDKGLATFLGAFIGACAALVGGWLSGVRQERLESKKIELERIKLDHAQKALVLTEARQVIQECISKMASATHSMCWLTWLSTVSPERIVEKRIDMYDEEMHLLLPEIIGLHARISTYNRDMGKKVSKIIKNIEDLDARIGEAALKYLSGNKTKIEKLIKYHNEADSLHKKLSNLSYDTKMEELIPKAE